MNQQRLLQRVQKHCPRPAHKLPQLHGAQHHNVRTVSKQAVLSHNATITDVTIAVHNKTPSLRQQNKPPTAAIGICLQLSC
jgi:hypothetical protein